MAPMRLPPCSVSCRVLERSGPEPFRNGSVGLMAGFLASVHLLSLIATSCAKEWRNCVLDCFYLRAETVCLSGSGLFLVAPNVLGRPYSPTLWQEGSLTATKGQQSPTSASRSHPQDAGTSQRAAGACSRRQLPDRYFILGG